MIETYLETIEEGKFLPPEYVTKDLGENKNHHELLRIEDSSSQASLHPEHTSPIEPTSNGNCCSRPFALLSDCTVGPQGQTFPDRESDDSKTDKPGVPFCSKKLGQVHSTISVHTGQDGATDREISDWHEKNNKEKDSPTSDTSSFPNNTKLKTTPSCPDSGTDAGRANRRSLAPSREKAWNQYLFAVRENAALDGATLRKVYDWLKENSKEEEFPSFSSWERYIREVRAYCKASKHTPRAGWELGRCIVRPGDI